jgi:uncharacterized protein YdeI (YjbR/CyaY-like superfamily)
MQQSPKFFSNQTEFRKWLEKNYSKETEIIVGFYKVNTGIPSITWPQSVEVALCFGWIDGIRRSIDEKSYCIRFTPRKPNSNWSNININKVKELTEKGLMHPAGLLAFEKRDNNKTKLYSYENETLHLSETDEDKFKTNKIAWLFFKIQTQSYKKTAIKWVLSAKQESTKQNRLNQLIQDCELGVKIKPLNYRKK